MFDPRITLQQQVSEQLKAHFGDKVFDTVIPRNVRLAEAPSYGMPGVVFDPASKGAQAFIEFAREMAARADARSVAGMTAQTFAPGRCWSRIEDAGLNASAPPQQRWIDGWLVRFSPGKAKRARCVNAVAAGRLPLDEKLARCQRGLRRRRACRCIVRITPFSQPRGLDEQLAARGMERFDDTRVMVASLDAVAPADAERAADAGDVAAAVDGDALRRSGRRAARLVALAQRRPTPSASRNRRCRIARSASRDARRRVLACGQIAIEGDMVGLYDVFTAERRAARAWRARCARSCCSSRGATARASAYLQVEASNVPARARLRAPRLRRRLRLPLPHAAAPAERRGAGAQSPCPRRGRGARSSTAPRRRWRPCRGCRAAPSAAPGSSLAKTKRSTRLVSLQACTSK